MLVDLNMENYDTNNVNTHFDCEDISKTLQHVQNFDTLLRCTICYDHFETCMVTQCSHNFCAACIRHHLASKNRCPTCFVPIQCNQVKPNRLIDDMKESFFSLKKTLSRLFSQVNPNEDSKDCFEKLMNVLTIEASERVAYYDKIPKGFMEDREDEVDFFHRIRDMGMTLRNLIRFSRNVFVEIDVPGTDGLATNGAEPETFAGGSSSSNLEQSNNVGSSAETSVSFLRQNPTALERISSSLEEAASLFQQNSTSLERNSSNVLNGTRIARFTVSRAEESSLGTSSSTNLDQVEETDLHNRSSPIRYTIAHAINDPVPSGQNEPIKYTIARPINDPVSSEQNENQDVNNDAARSEGVTQNKPYPYANDPCVALKRAFGLSNIADSKRNEVAQNKSSFNATGRVVPPKKAFSLIEDITNNSRLEVSDTNEHSQTKCITNTPEQVVFPKKSYILKNSARNAQKSNIPNCRESNENAADSVANEDIKSYANTSCKQLSQNNNDTANTVEHITNKESVEDKDTVNNRGRVVIGSDKFSGQDRNVVNITERVETAANREFSEQFRPLVSIPCGLCGVSVSSLNVASHAFQCESLRPNVSARGSSRSSQRHSSATNPQDVEININTLDKVPRQHLPTYNFQLMSIDQLFNKCQSLGLRTDGNVGRLRSRLRRFMVIYNIECDLRTPRPVRDIIRQIHLEEDEAFSYYMGRRSAIPRINDNMRYLRENKNSFDKLIKEVRQRNFPKMIDDDTAKEDASAKPPVTSSVSTSSCDESVVNNCVRTCTKKKSGCQWMIFDSQNLPPGCTKYVAAETDTDTTTTVSDTSTITTIAAATSTSTTSTADNSTVLEKVSQHEDLAQFCRPSTSNAANTTQSVGLTDDDSGPSTSTTLSDTNNGANPPTVSVENFCGTYRDNCYNIRYNVMSKMFSSTVRNLRREYHVARQLDQWFQTRENHDVRSPPPSHEGTSTSAESENNLGVEERNNLKRVHSQTEDNGKKCKLTDQEDIQEDSDASTLHDGTENERSKIDSDADIQDENSGKSDENEVPE